MTSSSDTIRERVADFRPDPAQQQWLKKIEAVCRKVIGPSAEEVDQERYIPRENYIPLVSLGLAGLGVGQEYGGVGERLTTAVLIGRVLAKACPSTFFAFLSHSWRVAPTLENFGNDWLKNHYLRQLCSGVLQGGWALAEKLKGGSANFIMSTACKSGDEYVLNGVKSFVAGASEAEFFIVILRLEKQDGPLAAFVVDRRLQGLKRGPRIETVGMRGAHVADLILENCRVPAKSLLAGGPECERMLAFSQNYTFIGLATLGTGIIDACLTLCKHRAESRMIGPKKLGDFEEVAERISSMQLALDTTSKMTLQAATEFDKKADPTLAANLARAVAAEKAVAASTDAMQIFGSAGYIAGSVVERLWRDARFLMIGGEPVEATRRRIALLQQGQQL